MLFAKSIIRILVLAAAGLSVAACQYSPDMTERTLSYNQSVVDSTKELFLLNAVRDSRHDLVLYSRNVSDTATSTIAPSTTLTDADPLGRSLSIGRTVGGPSNGAIVTTLATAAKGLAATLSATETNQLTLQNLDDQASMTGLLSAVDLKYFDHFSKEGWNFEELFLMFTSDIRVNRAALYNMPAAMKAYCENVDRNPQPGARSGEHPYCKYFSRAPTDKPNGFAWGHFHPQCFGHALTGPAADPLGFDRMAKNDKGFFSSKATSMTPDEARQIVVLVNDPALDGEVPKPNADGTMPDLIPKEPRKAQRTFTCFQEVARMLFAFDLVVAPKPPKLLYEIDAKVAGSNPRYLADLTQQSLDVAFVTVTNKTEKGTHRIVGVCKAGDSFGFQITTDPATNDLLDLSAPQGATEHPSAPDENRLQVFYEHPASNHPDPGATPAPATVDCASLAAAADAKAAKPVDPDAKPTFDSTKAIGSVSFTARSLEGMVYYIGQNIRRTVHLNYRQPVRYLNAAQEANQPYEEILFWVDTGFNPIADTVASVRDEGIFYSVPQLCGHGEIRHDPAYVPDDDRNTEPGRAPVCSWESPDHASPQILSLLNEIWGLQKSAASLPVTPTVTLIGH
jgi:hypothetical protein